MPWRFKRREMPNLFDNPFALLDGADDLAGAAFALVMGIVLVIFGGVILSLVVFGGEAVLLLFLLIPVIVLARMFWVLPWVIEVTYGEDVIGLEKVRGWRASQERIRAIAAAYERGERQVPTRHDAAG